MNDFPPEPIARDMVGGDPQWQSKEDGGLSQASSESALKSGNDLTAPLPELAPDAENPSNKEEERELSTVPSISGNGQETESQPSGKKRTTTRKAK